MARFSAKDLLKEARRRRVFRTAGLYVVGAWVAVQIALAAFPALSISEAAIRYIWTAALLGFPLAVVFGWRYDIRGGRVVRAVSMRTDVSLSQKSAHRRGTSRDVESARVASLNRSIAVRRVTRGSKPNIVLVVMSAFGRS